MHRTRRIRLCGLVALGLTLGLGSGIGAAFAQDKTFELKLSHWVPPSHPLQKALKHGAIRSSRISAAPSNTRSIHRSSSARHSTITTWRVTVSPM